MCNSYSDMISVVIPSYNRAYLIKEAVENVLEQSYTNIEVIVVDDGSIDNTVDIVNQILDTRVRIFRLNRNSGMCAARNAGAEIAKGRYIACQDTDVLWDKNKLEKQYNFIKKYDYDLVFCRVLRGVKDRKMTCFPPNEFTLNSDTYEELLKGNFIDSPSIFMKKNVCERVKFDPEIRRLTDWEFALRVAKAGYRIGYLPEALVTSYILKDSTSLTVNTYDAYNAVYRKHQISFDSNSFAMSKMMYILGESILQSDRKKAKKYYCESLKYKWSNRALFGLIFSLMGFKQPPKIIIRHILDSFKLNTDRRK